MPALSPDDIAGLAPEGRLERVPRRAIVPLDAPLVTIVAEGWFRVFRNAAFVRDVTLVLAGPGEVLAPGALFGDRSAESGAQAITAGCLLVVAAETLARRAAATPALYVAIARSLARRALAVQRKLEAFSRATVEARVAGALLELAENTGVAVAGGGIRLELPLSQDDLAALAGTTRESCSAAVASLARHGLVRGSRLRGLLLTDPGGLAGLAAVDLRSP
ncbi:MAG: Crp/Fnr family transcriptional regulator [Candidatus Eremiobacteraeota bacterium]|nr:Crp/Fnr family transcriptional regulator [Candidatus Eremiobacteraeota bacterium]